MIRTARPADGAALAAIYNHYVLNSTVTFEETAVPAEDMGKRVEAVQAADLPWLVYEAGGDVVGYAYATKWRERSAYRYSVESTVYVRGDRHGRGIARQLYGALLDTLRAAGIHTVIGGIAQPNLASVALHEKMGFEKCALFRDVGRKFDRWIDVGYWQLMLRGGPAD